MAPVLCPANKRLHEAPGPPDPFVSCTPAPAMAVAWQLGSSNATAKQLRSGMAVAMAVAWELGSSSCRIAATSAAMTRACKHHASLAAFGPAVCSKLSQSPLCSPSLCPCQTHIQLQAHSCLLVTWCLSMKPTVSFTSAYQL